MNEFPNITKISAEAASKFAEVIIESAKHEPDDEIENDAITLCQAAGIATEEQCELKMFRMTTLERLEYIEKKAGEMLLMPAATPTETKEFYATVINGYSALVCANCGDTDIEEAYNVPSHCICEQCGKL